MKHKVKEVIGDPIYQTNPVSGHEFCVGYKEFKKPLYTTDCALGQKFTSLKKAEEHAKWLDKFCFFHCKALDNQ